MIVIVDEMKKFRELLDQNGIGLTILKRWTQKGISAEHIQRIINAGQ